MMRILFEAMREGCARCSGALLQPLARLIALAFTRCTMRPKSLQRALQRRFAAPQTGVNFRPSRRRRRCRRGLSFAVAYAPNGGFVSAHVLPLLFHTGTGPTRRNVQIDRLVIAGWTGRDKAAVEKHIAELEALGVKRPATTPIFYRASAARLTTGEDIEALGNASSGEAEFVMLQHGGRLWVGAGSDHTDREVEAYGVSVSKQMCEKPIAPAFWAYEEVAPHWERLILRSYVSDKGWRVLYQEGPLTAMLDPLNLIEQFAGTTGLEEGTLMFCGTLVAKGGVRPSPYFDFEIEDPVLARKIQHRYQINTLPVLG
jgi:hypothetical protein